MIVPGLKSNPGLSGLRSRSVLLVWLVMTLFSSSCITRTEVKQLKSESSATNRMVAETDSLTMENNLAIRDLGTELDSIKVEIRKLRGLIGSSLEGDSYSVFSQQDRLDQIEQMLHNLIANSGEVEERMEGRQLFESAYKDMRAGNLSLAIDEFGLFLDRFPDSPRADDAMYYSGECRLQMDSTAAAVETFRELTEKYPEGDVIPAALLEMGVTQENTGDIEEAAETYRLLSTKFPETREGELALRRLELLDSMEKDEKKNESTPESKTR